MVEVEGDPIKPSSITLPTEESTAISGAAMIFWSGAKVWIHTGAAFELVTSA